MITATASPSQSPSPEMLGLGPGMTIGAGPVYGHATMGQGPSTTTTDATFADIQRGKIRKATSTIWREDSIEQHFEESTRCPSPVSPLIEQQTVPLSRPDSWSMHYHCTTQAPYSNPAAISSDDNMITQTSLLRMPKYSDMYDLAFFLRTTGPAPPHRKPSKIEHPRRAVSGRNALRLLRLGGQKQQQRHRYATPVQTAHERSVLFVLRCVAFSLIPIRS